IIATVFRVYQLERIPPGLYPDEAMNGNNALEALRGGEFSAEGGPASGWKVYYPENNGREGLFINIQALFLKTAGLNEPWVLRLPSAIFGILTVWGLYLLGKELFSKRVGLLAAFFMAVSVWHIIFSRIGFRAIMAPFFAVWAIYLLLKAIHNPNSKFQIPNSILAGILFGLGFYTYIAYRVSPLLLILFIIFFRKIPNFWKVLLVFLGVTFIVALPIGIYYLQNPADFMGRTSQISVFSSATPLKDLALNIGKTLAMFNFVGDGNWRHNFASRPELFWPVGILMWLGVVLGFKALFHKQHPSIIAGHTEDGFLSWESEKNLRFAYSLLFAWLILAFLPVVISNEGLPHALRSIFMIPPLFLLAATGGIFAYTYFQKHMRETAVLNFAAVILGLLLIYEASQTYFLLWGRNPKTAGAFAKDYAEIGWILNRLPQTMPKYVIVEAGGVPVRGIPMPTQTVMFLTDTFSPESQAAKNIHYIPPAEEANIPQGAVKFYLR
ncbi:MAG: glycosyltransferase family 39 protein, partial [Patescibacteria group bacterium]